MTVVLSAHRILISDFHKQCSTVKFCFLFGVTSTETHEVFKKTTYKDDAIGKIQVFSSFKSG